MHESESLCSVCIISKILKENVTQLRSGLTTYSIPFRLQVSPSRSSDVLAALLKARGIDDGRLICPK